MTDFPLEDMQRITRGLLLDHDPQLIDIDRLKATAGEDVDVDTALRLLLDAGVAVRLGGRCGVSQAARRVAQLGVQQS